MGDCTWTLVYIMVCYHFSFHWTRVKVNSSMIQFIPSSSFALYNSYVYFMFDYIRCFDFRPTSISTNSMRLYNELHMKHLQDCKIKCLGWYLEVYYSVKFHRYWVCIRWWNSLIKKIDLGLVLFKTDTYQTTIILLYLIGDSPVERKQRKKREDNQ